MARQEADSVSAVCSMGLNAAWADNALQCLDSISVIARQAEERRTLACFCISNCCLHVSDSIFS